MTKNAAPRVAIPIPRSDDPDYTDRALPQYEKAIADAGGEPVRILLDQPPAETMKLVSACDAVLLPGSGADVDPAKYGAERDPKTAPADARRDAIDELLLQDAYKTRKPILAICYGLQILNVHRSGTLVQHIPDFLPAETKDLINHEAGRKIEYAHRVVIDPQSKLAGITGSTEIAANSSHHQSAGEIGDGLRVVARCKEDGIIEALEGTAPEHFVLAVQWHPERTTGDAPSRAIFSSLVEAARARQQQLLREFESV